MDIAILIPLLALISRATFAGRLHQLCDFTQVTAGAWATYHKNPRNLPEQSGFSSYIEWPEKPED